MFESLLLLDGHDSGLLGLLNHLEKNKATEFIKHPTSLPQKGRFVVFVFIREMYLPEFLRDKLFNLLVSFNDKTECWKLAWTIADHTLSLYHIS
jgi:hypothetical protein